MSEPEARQLLVLLIEDDPEDALLVTNRLEAVLGSESVHVATTMAAASDALVRDRLLPDVILADLHLPDARGAHLLTHLKEVAPQVPVIVISKLHTHLDVQELAEKNAQDYLSKDWIEQNPEPLALLLRLNGAVERYRYHGNIVNVLNLSPSGLVVLSQSGIVRFSNHRVTQMFGNSVDLSRGAEFGVPISRDGNNIQTMYGRTLECRTYEVEWNHETCLLVTFQDVTEYISLEAEVQRNNEQLRTTNAVLRRTVEELSEATRQLREEREQSEARAAEAEAANRAKSEFLANISHELRTPLNAMLVLSGIMARNEEQTLPAEEAENARIVHESGETLLQLINEVLDLSRIESGQVELYAEPTAIADIAERIRGRYAPGANAKGIDFEVRLDSCVPESLVIDRGRTEQILGNLIGNAVKFTEKGGVRVEFLTGPPPGADSGHDADQLLVRIRDTGIGIDPVEFEHIFEPFRQADGSSTRKYGGTGLGLAISRNLAQLQGGDIHLQSKRGAGSCFTLWLPLNRTHTDIEKPAEAAPTVVHASAPPVPGKAELAPSPHLRDRVALVADDDMRNVFALATLLRAHGMKVHRAAGCEKALEILGERESEIEVLLMGAMTYAGNGTALLRGARTRPAQESLVIIVCTDEPDGSACLDAGADGWLPSPVTEKSLVKMLEEKLPARA